MAAAALSSCRVSLPSCSRRHGAQRAGRQQRQQVVAAVHGTPAHADVGDLHRFQQLWTPPAAQLVDVQARGGAPAAAASAGDDHKPRTPPPDLPSLLLDSRIVYLGMPLVPAVTELVISELLWLNYAAPDKPIYVYINSTGSQTAQGEAVGFETEATAIMDTMAYIRPEIYTLVIGQAFGNAAMILASGKKGQRYALPNARIMTAPPRLNRSFGSVSNVMIKANELEQSTQTYVDFMSRFTGRDKEEVRTDVGRNRYFTPEEAVQYGIIDKVMQPSDAVVIERRDYEGQLRASQAQNRPRSSGGAAAGADM